MKLKSLTAVGALIMTSAATVFGAPHQKIKYKQTDQANLELHIYNPPNHDAAKPKPAIVFFNGGGFQGGGPSQFYGQAEYLASRGMVAVCAEYRTIKTHKTTPLECIKDAKSAMRYVYANADKLGIKKDMIAAGGGSAGGHLATAVATLKEHNDENDDLSVSCQPKALVLFNPVFYIERKSNGGWGYGHGQTVAKLTGLDWKTFSPCHNLSSNTPPAIVMLGDKDDKLPVSTCERIKKEMESNGVRCDLHVYKDQVHSFFNKKNSKEYYIITLREADKFLTSLGYLTGKPTL